MAKVVKKEIKKATTKKASTKKPVTKKIAAKKASVCKCGPKRECKTQKVSVKSVKMQTPVKKSFWTKIAEFFGF